MPREPVRFIHAARLSLDHQLHGLGSLPDGWTEKVRDATLTAFQRLIKHCAEQRVDFLLLTGDSFDARDESLRAQATLARGFHQLAAQGIPVYVCAGLRDPWEAWLPEIRLPSTVHTLGEAGGESIAIVRRGAQSIATIRWLPREMLAGQNVIPTSIPSADSTNHRPLTIGVSCFDGTAHPPHDSAGESSTQPVRDAIARLGIEYWALGGAGEFGTTFDGALTIHRSGATQGIGAEDQGIGGCTLVEVPAEGKLQLTRLATAPIRWERIEVTLTGQASSSELVDAFRAAAERVSPAPGEELRLVTWKVRSEGPLPECLSDESSRRTWIESLPREIGSAVTKLTGVALHTVALDCDDACAMGSKFASADSMSGEFRRRLDDRLTDRNWSPARCLAGSTLPGGPWQSAMESVIATLDGNDVARRARRQADNWFEQAGEFAA